MSERKTPQWLLAGLTAAVPVVLLLLLEFGLRVAGFGSVEPLFLPSTSYPGYLEANGTVARRFVSDPTAPPITKIDAVFFRREKRTGALRFVVQGGSTAAGFPYGRFASLAGMLNDRLRLDFPEREVEVISTAMSAVNSYTLLDFAAEIAAIEPDVVLVYAGHNEYLGLLGVGSAFSVSGSQSLNRAFLALRGLRIFQGLRRVLSSLRAAEGARVVDEDVTLMARVVGESEIELDSELFRRGVSQFRDNMSGLLAVYQRRGIPVMLGTLVSNEGDHWPFLSRDDGERSAKDYYARGLELESAGDYPAARAAFREAKERDLLRFRAPEAMNEVIRELSAQYGAVLVDVQAAFAAASPHGIVGNELMLEHLHPNVRGYALLADQFYEALRARGEGFEAAENTRSLATSRPVSEIDRLAGEYPRR